RSAPPTGRASFPSADVSACDNTTLTSTAKMIGPNRGPKIKVENKVRRSRALSRISFVHTTQIGEPVNLIDVPHLRRRRRFLPGSGREIAPRDRRPFPLRQPAHLRR